VDKRGVPRFLPEAPSSSLRIRSFPLSLG
jgi:hypothetical protein